jgi:hypothetical protein
VEHPTRSEVLGQCTDNDKCDNDQINEVMEPSVMKLQKEERELSCERTSQKLDSPTPI